MVHLEELNKYNVWDVIELTAKKRAGKLYRRQ